MANTAQNDCTPKPSALMRPEDALARLAVEITPITDTRSVTPNTACGRILAANVVSHLNLPPHDNSAMDGYAVHADDLRADAPTHLPLSARIKAGDAPDAPVPRGTAARIFTGAAMPNGPDTVVMQEDCESDGDTVTIKAGVKPFANVRKAGEDVKAGQTVLTAGTRLTPRHIALASAVGGKTLSVIRPIRVAIFSTGDELMDGHPSPPPGKINDANRPMLLALYREWGCDVSDMGIVPDDPETLRARLGEAAKNHDLIVTSGGVSVGEEDHVRKTVLDLGGSLDFWKLRIKPGKPTAVGKIGDAVFLGLPGNPVAALVVSYLIGYPALQALNGLPPTRAPRYPVTSGFSRNRKPGREEYLRVVLREETDGRLTAVAPEAQGSGILSTLAQADGLVVIDADCATIEDGDTLPFIPFGVVGA